MTDLIQEFTIFLGLIFLVKNLLFLLRQLRFINMFIVGGKRVGFYSGYTLANRLGLSTQVPIKEEITSNYAPAQVREVSIKNQKYLIRRPAVTITEENAYVLQLLDCLKDIDKSAEEDMKKCGKILTNYANEHRITREQVDKLLAYYPLKIYKAIYETGVKYVSA